MITDTMTSEELRRELLADEKWVRGRIDGLRKKYHKKLKDKTIRENTLRGGVETQIRGWWWEGRE